MPVTILCPKLTCRAVLRVPEQIRGQRIRCGECGTAFMIPQRPAPTPPPKVKNVEPEPSKDTEQTAPS